MGRKAKWPPEMTRHHTGRARVSHRGRDYWLGTYGTVEARQAYDALIEKLAREKDRPRTPQPAGPTVAQAVALWVAEELPLRAEKEQRNYRRALACLVRVRGEAPAAEFGADDLRAVRKAMLTGSWLAEAEKAGKGPRKEGKPAPPRGKCGPWSRKTTNRQVTRIKTVWSWLSSESRKTGVPAGAYGGLLTVKALRQGQPGAPPDRERPSFTLADVVAVALAIRRSPARRMLLVQLLAGMRSGEVRGMRWAEIERGPKAWVYRPKRHKLAHLGIPRVIVLGPRAQAVLALQRAAEPRGDLVFPCRFRGKVTGAYSSRAYAGAVQKAARRLGLEGFRPYAARHVARKQASDGGSLEEARALLGHTTASMTAQYGERHDLTLATRAALRIG